ncbi:MAG: aminotransferase class V-fold PLP-dependent enzyme [Wolinella sp.]
MELDENFALFPAGNGATGALKKFQELLGIYLPPRTKKRLGSALNASAFPLVIVGPYEHHSNEISYRETPCEMVRLPLDSRGFFDLKAFEKELKKHHGREIIGAFSFASNATGIQTPLKEISALMREHGGILALDMASASAYMNAPCELFDAAFYSPHKLLGGGVGSCGVLAMRRELIDSSISPTFGGGGSITYVSRVDHYYREDLETREEAGTPNVFALIRAALAYRLRNEIGLEWIAKQKSELCRWLLGALSKIDGAQIYGDRECSQKMGIIALNLEGISPYEVTKRLSHEYLIETRAGCNCAGPHGHDLLGAEG